MGEGGQAESIRNHFMPVSQVVFTLVQSCLMIELFADSLVDLPSSVNRISTV